MKITRGQLGRIIREEARRLHEASASSDDGDELEIVDRMVEAFKLGLRNSSDPALRSEYEDTGEHNDWLDVGPVNKRHESAYMARVAKVEQEVLDGILPVVQEALRKLREYEV